MSEISVFGTFDLEFNKDIDLSKAYRNNTFKLNILMHEEELYQYEYDWKIVEYTNRTLKIDLEFNDTILVSSG